MNLVGFGAEGAQYYLDKLLELDEYSDESHELVSRVRQLVQEDNVVRYTLPGLPVCWKCTLKHVGQALGFAAELEAYPERIACVVGELGHAYRECPDKDLAQYIRVLYLRILDTGCVEDMTELLKRVVKGWKSYLQEDK